MKVDKSKWRPCKLDDCIISLRTGLNPRKNFTLNESGATNFYITVRELNGREITISDKTDLFCDYAFPLINHRSNLEKGDVLFSGTGSIGRTALVHETPKNWNIKEGVYVIKPKQDVLDSVFLLYYLHSAPLLEFCHTFSKGATIQSVPMGRLRSAEILLPNIKQQKSIASELDALQAVIDGYRGQIADLDALAQSIFLETFGDPISNPKGWDIEKLGCLGSIARGVSKHRPRNAPELLGGVMPLIQTGDIANAGLFINSYSATYSELGVSQSKIWPKGTLCITIAANIGKTAIMTFEACFPDSVVGFTPDTSKCSAIFVLFCFKEIQKILEANAGGVAQKNINLSVLNSLKLPLPPIELQQQFADQVEEIEKQKDMLRQQLADADMLMAERMQYYFSD